MHEAGGLLGRRFSDALDALAEGGLGRYPAEAAARGDGFREGVEADDAAFCVNGEVGGDEGVEEGEAGGFGGTVVPGFWLDTLRCGFTTSCWGRAVCGWVLDVPVWVVFDDDDVVFAADGIDFSATADA